MATAVLVGRPNVGKSTLFNSLTGKRQALVADVPGLTRDRRYGRISTDQGPITLIDTGGLFGEDDFAGLLAQQVDTALAEADVALWLVDAREGLVPDDHAIAARLRRAGIPTLLVINKIDGVPETAVATEFAELGLDTDLVVAASHGKGVARLLERVAGQLAKTDAYTTSPEHIDPAAIRVAVIGRPNVGKSTLSNRLLGEERQLVFDGPGTTRDAIDLPVVRGADSFVLIDTAGVRRKGRTDGIVEKFSVVKTLDAIERAHLVLLVFDAREGLVEQDLHLLGYALEAGRGLLIVMNKWDGLSQDERQRVRTELDRRLNFATWIPVRMISALHGTGVGDLWDEMRHVHAAGRLNANTSRLTQLLESFVAAHPPPGVRGRLIKLRFAHPAGEYPPTIAIHGNQTSSLPASYVRYLENSYRQMLDLYGNPVRIALRSGDNPFAGKSNPLSGRQQKRRGRLIAHRKKSDRRKRRKTN